VAKAIGIRREDMYHWERRTPLVPEDAAEISSSGIEVIVQSSDKRAFPDDDYRRLGLRVVDSLEEAPVSRRLARRGTGDRRPEGDPDRRVRGGEGLHLLLPYDKGVYTFFSHTIKGQPANMPMLMRALDLRCTIIDYERIVDDASKRLIFFGNFAGLAGAIDTLWTLGLRLAWEGIETPFLGISQASTYPDLEAAKGAIRGRRPPR